MQLDDADAGAPVSPPTTYLSENFQDSSIAREDYNKKVEQIIRKVRKYLLGSYYNGVFEDSTRIVDPRDFNQDIELQIDLPDKTTSILRVKDLSHETGYLQVIDKFNAKMRRSSTVRKESGDIGKMFAFGVYNKKKGNYVSMRDTSSKLKCRIYCLKMAELFGKYFPIEVDQIRKSDKDQGAVTTWELGGDKGISGYFLVSKDLKNASHYDLDAGMSVTIFVEKEPGMAKDWLFVLPNVVQTHKPSTSFAIQLFHGCSISWDGRVIRHCTAYTDVGKGNSTYGNFFGGKFYKKRKRVP